MNTTMNYDYTYFIFILLKLYLEGIEQAIYDYDYEALEDIWLKAGEIEPEDATFTTDEGYGSRSINIFLRNRNKNKDFLLLFYN